MAGQCLLGRNFSSVSGFRRRHKLSILDDCLLWGSRIIIPPAGQSCLLDKLHETHPGASRIKVFGSQLRLVAKDGL